MKKIYAIAGFVLPLLLASEAGAASITWVQYELGYGHGIAGFLPKVAAAANGLGLASIFQSGTGFAPLLYETATDLDQDCGSYCSPWLVWSPATNNEANPGDVVAHAPSISLINAFNNHSPSTVAIDTALEVHQGEDGASLWSTLGTCNLGWVSPPRLLANVSGFQLVFERELRCRL